MRAQVNGLRSPCEPISDRRCAASGARGVKLATGHGGVGNQALHGNFATGNSIKLRQLQTIGTWNVRGLNQVGKLTILEQELERVGVDICGVSETHWKGNGHLLTDQHAVYFSGNDISSSNGVAFLVQPAVEKTDPTQINSRIESQTKHKFQMRVVVKLQ